MDCKIRLIFFGLFLVPGLIGMLCMTAGYVNYNNKNEKYVSATCQCVSTQIINDRCYDSCCYRDDEDDCVGCYYDCYSGIVNADIENVTIKAYALKVYTNDYKNKVNAYLNVHYPLNKLFHCYYTFQDDNVVISLSMYNTFPPFVAGLVFLSISGIFLLIWLICECCTFGAILCDTLPHCCGNIYECCFSCCSRCKNRFNQAREIQAETRERRGLIKYAQNNPPQYDYLQRANSQSAPSAPPMEHLNININ